MVDSLTFRQVSHLSDAVEFLNGRPEIVPFQFEGDALRDMCSSLIFK